MPSRRLPKFARRWAGNVAHDAGQRAPGKGRPEAGKVASPGNSLSRAFGRLMLMQKWLCGALIVAMAVLITAEVVSREVFDRSLHVTHEMAGYLLVTVAFLGFGVSLHERALFRVDFLFRRLSVRKQDLVQIAFDLVALGASLILEYQLILLVVSSYTRGFREATVLATPLFIPQLAMPVGIGLMIVVLLGQVVTGVGRLVGGRAAPPGGDRPQ